MAKLSKIVANEKKKKLVEKYYNKRQELKKVLLDPEASPEQKGEAMRTLQRLPKNSSPVRVRNRCELTGRPRAYLRKFRLSRIQFREMALRGMIPGVTKSSW